MCVIYARSVGDSQVIILSIPKITEKASSKSAYNRRNNRILHQLSPIVTKAPGRAVAAEGRCVRAGGNESQRRLSSAVSSVYSTRTNMHFDTTGTQRSFVHSTTMSPLYRVPAVFAPRDSEPARRGDRLLSHVEMSGTKL